MRTGAVAFVITLILGMSAQTARAAAYPFIPIASDDIRVVASPRADVELRLRMIEGARTSIDIANYDQRTDEAVAYPILSALRDAANRGVRVRYLTSALSQLFLDHNNHVARYLIDPPTRRPIEYVIFGGPLSQDDGWNLFDAVHDKVFIVDDQYALTTGRGFGENYLHWLDTTFALKGGLVDQSLQAFNELWSAVRRERTPYAGSLMMHQNPASESHSYGRSEAARSNATETRLVEDLLEWFKRPGRDQAARGRVLHYDFIRQLRERAIVPSEWSVTERLERLEDPVVDALVERLATAREIRLNILVLNLHPKVKQALIEARRRPGTRIRILTNTTTPELGGGSRDRIVAGGPMWSLELPDLDDLLTAKVPVHQFQINRAFPWIYAHRKLAILDDTVIFGSHNFNAPSTVGNDEISYEIENPELAAELRTLFDADFDAFAEPIDAARVRRERDRADHSLMRFFTWPFLGVM